MLISKRQVKRILRQNGVGGRKYSDPVETVTYIQTEVKGAGAHRPNCRWLRERGNIFLERNKLSRSHERGTKIPTGGNEIASRYYEEMLRRVHEVKKVPRVPSRAQWRLLADIQRFFGLFNGGRPPSWICCMLVWTNHQEYFGGLYRSAKFGWSRCSNFDNMQLLIFCEFGLKRLFTPQTKFFGDMTLQMKSNVNATPKGTCCV